MAIPFLWGTEKKILTDFSQTPGTCPKCNKEGVFAHVYQQYQHLLGIPLYPTHKAYKIRCRGCGKHYYGEAVPLKVQEHISRQRKQAGTPLSLYIGLVIVPATIISIILLFY